MTTYTDGPLYVYLATLKGPGSNEVRTGHSRQFIEYQMPNVTAIGIDEEAPTGFDGGWIVRRPKFPALIMSTLTPGDKWMPNTIVNNDAELSTYEAKALAQHYRPYRTTAQ